MPTAAIQDPVTQAYTGAANAAQGNLAGQSAAANLAAAPSLQTLSELVNQINRTANQARIPGGAALEAQSSQNIANELAGVLPESFLDTLQTGLAESGAARGFGIDTPALNASALRAMGLQELALQQQGQKDLSAAYERAAPLWDVSKGMVTPDLLEQQQYHQALVAAEAAQRSDATARWRAELQARYAELGASNARYAQDAALRLQIAQMEHEQAQMELSEKQREYNITRDTNVLQQIADLSERARQAQMQVQLSAQQLNAQIYETNLKFMRPAASQVTAETMASLPNYVQLNLPQYQAPRIPTLTGMG